MKLFMRTHWNLVENVSGLTYHSVTTKGSEISVFNKNIRIVFSKLRSLKFQYIFLAMLCASAKAYKFPVS